jgi:5'-nucleotidase
VRVLITNDDGIDSPGLHTLAEVAARAGLEVLVAAPHEERSGSSASLGALREDGRLVMSEYPLEGLDEVRGLAVEATPAFITWAAVRGAFGPEPDIVLSGVNRGPNTGHAVLHSGTVGAALTATAHGIPAMAVSLSGPDPSHWETAREVTTRSLDWFLGQTATDSVVINVNIPDVPLDKLEGIRSAPLASFGAVQADVSEIGEGFVTITYSQIDVSSEPDSDAALQTANWATVTAITGPREVEDFPLQGLTDHA